MESCLVGPLQKRTANPRGGRGIDTQHEQQEREVQDGRTAVLQAGPFSGEWFDIEVVKVKLRCVGGGSIKGGRRIPARNLALWEFGRGCRWV